MEALHIDGNGIAGLLGEIAAADMTAVVRTCQSCGDGRPIADIARTARPASCCDARTAPTSPLSSGSRRDG
jgi:hypothetical protein